MRFLLVLITFLAMATIGSAASIDQQILTKLQDSNGIPVIVVLNEGANAPSALETEKEIGIINAFSGNATRENIAELLSDPSVESIHINKPVKLFLDGSAPLVNATLAWSITLNGINITGTGETVCVIDTGINYTHPALGGGFGNKVVGGYDFVNSDNDSMDDNGHGTHVAGIIASSNATYRGIAPNASLVGIKVLNSAGSGTESDVILGIDWCVANSTQFNISVISMSLGSSLNYSSYCDASEAPFSSAINAAVAKNISVVVASGNDGFTANISSPACIQNATSVGSTTKTDGVSSFTNRNNITDLLAPGSLITSAVPTGSCTYCASSGFRTLSGTSMAAPHVSAAFALLRQFKKLENGTLLNPSQIENALKAAGKNISDSGLVLQRINVLRSLFLLDTTKPSLTVASPLNQTYNSTNISLSYSAFDNVSLDSCTFTNTTGSISALSGCANITFIAASGQNNVTLSANDSNGNLNSSQIFFTIDTVAPFLNVTSPENLTYQTNNITLNVTASDSNKIDRCWFVNTTGSTTFINNPRESCSNVTLISAEGPRNITVYVNDTGGNLNSSQIFFTANLSFVLAVQQPANSSYSSPNISVNYTLSGFDTCWLVLNDARTNVSGCTNTTVTAAQNQLNNITIFTNNSNGDINSTQILFTVDTLSPSMNFSSSTPNNETITTNDLVINISLSETGSVLLEWNGTNITMSGLLLRNHSFFDLADGNYSFRVFANDSLGNGNFTSFRWVFVNATRNFSSFISSLNDSLVSNSVAFVLLNTTGTGDASNILLKSNYTLRFNITGILAEIANFSWLSANTSNLINVTRNVSITNISAAFNSSGGVLDNYVWIDINNFTGNYTPKVTFAGNFRLNYYLNDSRESPDSMRINETCNTNFSNVPCYSISGGTTSVYLASFSGAAAGNDTQVPTISIASPSGTQTDSNVSLSYSATDNIAVDRCWFSLNSGANITPTGCSNTTFVPASGSNSLIIYANDSSGNLNSSSVTFTYSPPAAATSSGGGGGGGGGSTSSSPQTIFRKTWTTKIGNSSVSIGSIPVRFVSIVANTGSATLTISPEKTWPVELEHTYQYFSMNATNIKSAEIIFSINRSWLESNEINRSKVRLNRFDNGWIPLTTRLTGENLTHLTYASEIP